MSVLQNNFWLLWVKLPPLMHEFEYFLYNRLISFGIFVSLRKRNWITMEVIYESNLWRKSIISGIFWSPYRSSKKKWKKRSNDVHQLEKYLGSVKCSAIIKDFECMLWINTLKIFNYLSSVTYHSKFSVCSLDLLSYETIL